MQGMKFLQIVQGKKEKKIDLGGSSFANPPRSLSLVGRKSGLGRRIIRQQGNASWMGLGLIPAK